MADQSVEPERMRFSRHWGCSEQFRLGICFLAAACLLLGSLGSAPAARRLADELEACEVGLAPQPGETTYAVQRGDTLWSIASRLGVSLTCLASRNGIAEPGTLLIGRELIVPSMSVAVAPEQSRRRDDSRPGTATADQEVRLALLEGEAVGPVLSVSVAFVAVLWALLRWTRLSRYKRRLASRAVDVPEQLLEAWTRVDTSGNRVDFTVASITTGSVVFELSKIHPDVLTAVRASHGADVDLSLSGLVARLEALREKGGGALHGAVQRYKGYYGEELIAARLRAEGHLVQDVASPTNEGYDKLIDGYPWQIKVGLSELPIEQHLERFPEYPVLTVSEHLERFESVPNVFPLADVSGVDIEAVAGETIERLAQFDQLGGDIVGNVPWVLVTVSACRYGRIYLRGDCEFWSAIENTVTSVLAAMVGAGAGKEVGEAIGGLLGDEFGEGVGGAAGAVVGAVFGGQLGTAIKERRLRRAVRTLKTVLAWYPRLYAEGLKTKAEALELEARRYRAGRVRWLLWPRFEDATLEELAIRYSNWGKACRQRRNQVEAELADCRRAAVSNGDGTLRCEACGRAVKRASLEPASFEEYREDGTVQPWRWSGVCRRCGVGVNRECGIAVQEAVSRLACRLLGERGQEPPLSWAMASLLPRIESARVQVEIEQRKLGGTAQ